MYIAIIENDELVAEPGLAVVKTKVQPDGEAGLDQFPLPRGLEDPFLRITQGYELLGALFDTSRLMIEYEAPALSSGRHHGGQG